MHTPHLFPLIKLPTHLDQTLYLISEELKSRRLFRTLQKVGWEECEFQPHLDELIIRQIGLDGSDKTFDLYTAIMERRCRKVVDRESAVKQAMKAHAELEALRKDVMGDL